MRRKPTALIAFIVAVLVSGLGASTDTDGGGSRDRTVRVVADDRGPTAVTGLPQA
ncbi:hypothetical protein [Streptomyces sp. NPDC001536]|uniref:hypothetical protein n=1 Tax=Streptomyces sp. NPDC001536 TaxID=3364583 RepID=UPI00367BCE51